MKQILILILILFTSVGHAQKFEELAKTPPMGWNSWNKFGCDINEKLVMEVADAMVSSGMKDAGYEFIVIDDCWQVDRDSEGNIIADPERFPSGMKALADFVHSRGLKFGLYSDAGIRTCQGRPGSRGYEFQDARTYAEWGVDYLKYDWCSHGTQNSQASYALMRDALFKAGRPIVYSICEWGSTRPWEWAQDIGHLWRTTGDIIDCFDCKVYWGGNGVLQIIDLQVDIRNYNGPGHWNDPDMLEVGNGGMTESEERAHFSMWCMLAAPLMSGNDLRQMPETARNILTNKEVIAIDQDPLGISALRWMDYGDLEIWFKPLANGEYAFCLLNRSLEPMPYDVDLKTSIQKYRIDDSYAIRDLWLHKDIGSTQNRIKGTIPGHDVIMLKLTKMK